MESMPVMVKVPVPGTVGDAMTTVHWPLAFVPGPSTGSHVLREVSSAEPVGPVQEYVSVVPAATGWKPAALPSEKRTVSVNV